MFRAYFMRISAWIQLKKHNSGDNMEKCQWKHRFSRIMLQRCSNPEIRAEQGGFSALDQVNEKVTPVRLPIAYLPTRSTYNRLITRNLRKNGETGRWWPSIPKYYYSAPENSQRQGWTKIGKIAEQAHLSWGGVGPAAELNTPFTMNSISNAYDNIEIVHGCRLVPRLK